MVIKRQVVAPKKQIDKLKLLFLISVTVMCLPVACLVHLWNSPKSKEVLASEAVYRRDWAEIVSRYEPPEVAVTAQGPRWETVNVEVGCLSESYARKFLRENADSARQSGFTGILLENNGEGCMSSLFVPLTQSGVQYGSPTLTQWTDYIKEP